MAQGRDSRVTRTAQMWSPPTSQTGTQQLHTNCVEPHKNNPNLVPQYVEDGGVNEGKAVLMKIGADKIEINSQKAANK